MNQYITNLMRVFPRELLSKSCWVGYKLLNDTKVPINLKTGNPAKSNDPSTWVPFSFTKGALFRHKCDGLGFVLQPPFVGIDLDDCVVNGEINPFGKNVIEKLSSYTEYSPSGTGIHIICIGSIPKALKKDGVEVYTSGRFFTVTGNVHSNKGVIKDCTNELDELFNIKEIKPVNPKGWVADALNEMKVGNIDNTLTRILGRLRADNYSEQDALTFLKPHAEAKGATPGHLEEKIKHIWTAYKPNVSGDELLKEAQGKTVPQDDTYSISEFLALDDKVTWIVPGIISDKSLGFIAGLPETGKTWICMDLAVECARGGGYWLGKFPVKDAKVMYIDQERWKGETKRRLAAIIGAKAINRESIQENLFIKSGTTIRLDLQQSFDAFRREVEKLRPSLIIVDSFATFHTKEENNRKDIQEVLERIKQIRNEFGVAFLFVDHEGKSVFSDEDKTPSMAKMVGSIGKPAAAEYVLTVRKENEGSMVYHTKSTLGPALEPFLVKVLDLNDTKTKISVKAY